MNKSESINELAAALALAQGAMEAAAMDTRNQFGGVYADLGSIMQTAKGPLSANGLAVSQHPELTEGRVTLTTLLMHKSGQWIESSISAGIGDNRALSAAQQAGIVITYLRRYAYAAIVGIYADQDTDGAKVEVPKPERKPIDPSKVKPLTPPEPVQQPQAAAEPAPANWPREVLQHFVIEYKLQANNQAANMLNLSNLPKDTPLPILEAWVKHYKANRADGTLSTHEAAELANSQMAETVKEFAAKGQV